MLPHPQGSLLPREQMKGKEWREGQASPGEPESVNVQFSTKLGPWTLNSAAH